MNYLQKEKKINKFVSGYYIKLKGYYIKDIKPYKSIIDKSKIDTV